MIKIKAKDLALENFLEFMNSILGKTPNQEALLKEFNHADDDKNETISEEEFLQVARRAMSYLPSNAELRTWFQSFDKNADDLLDIEELKQMPAPSGESPSTDEIN